MKVIVCGAGQVGSQIARHLSDEGNAVTVVDNNAELVRNVTDALDLAGVVGFASHPDVLARAGAPDADLLIAATSTASGTPVAIPVGVGSSSFAATLPPTAATAAYPVAETSGPKHDKASRATTRERYLPTA